MFTFEIFWQTTNKRGGFGANRFPEAVWNSVVRVATEDRWFLRSTHFSPCRSCSVSLCGLPLPVWAVVVLRLFHFTITALTVDQSSFSRAAIWRTGKVASYDGAKFKVTELYSKIILLPMFVYGGCVLNFINLSATGVANLKRHPHTFVYIAVAVSAV